MARAWARTTRGTTVRSCWSLPRRPASSPSRCRWCGAPLRPAAGPCRPTPMVRPSVRSSRAMRRNGTRALSLPATIVTRPASSSMPTRSTQAPVRRSSPICGRRTSTRTWRSSRRPAHSGRTTTTRAARTGHGWRSRWRRPAAGRPASRRSSPAARGRTRCCWTPGRRRSGTCSTARSRARWRGATSG